MAIRPALALAAFVIAGCAASAPTPAPLQTPSSLATPALSTPTRDPGYVTKAEYGKDWPFTVSAGTLKCHEVYSVVIDIDGEEYALNGDARGSGKYRELNKKLLIDYPDRSGTLDLIQRGLKLCD